MIASGLYFLAMLVLFLLVHKEVIRIKENALLHILLEDWLTQKEKERYLDTTEEVVISEEVATETTTIQLDVPNLDILSMDSESAKMAIS